MNDFDYEIRGFYKPSFFSLYMNGDFNEDFSLMSQKNLGTFVHEYIHYLQNITTILGLKNSQFYFQYLYEVKKYIYEKETIEIPIINVPHSINITEGEILFELYNGTNKFYNPQYDCFDIEIIEITKNGNSIKSLCLKLFNQREIIDTIYVGNTCIKESMARLIQLLFDCNSNHNTFPYKTAEIIANKVYLDILNDKYKLITICLLSLNSQNSGLAFYELLIKSKNYSELNGIEFYKKYFHDYKIFNNNHEVDINSYFLNSLKLFKETLKGTLISELVHFEKLIFNIELSIKENRIPLIDALYDDESNSLQWLQKIISYYGIPHIRTKDGYNYFPKISDSDSFAEEYVELLGQQAVFERVLGIDLKIRNHTCSLFPICQNSDIDITDNHCFNKQWLRQKSCHFLKIFKYWKLDEKMTDNVSH